MPRAVATHCQSELDPIEGIARRHHVSGLILMMDLLGVEKKNFPPRQEKLPPEDPAFAAGRGVEYNTKCCSHRFVISCHDSILVYCSATDAIYT